MQSTVKGEGTQGESQGDQAHASRSPLPVQSHGTRLTSPLASWDNTCGLWPTRDTHRASHPGLVLGAGHTGTLRLARTQIPDSRGEAGVQHKPCCLHKQCGHNKLLLSAQGMLGALPPIQVPRCQPRITWQAASVLPEVLTPFSIADWCSSQVCPGAPGWGECHRAGLLQRVWTGQALGQKVGREWVGKVNIQDEVLSQIPGLDDFMKVAERAAKTSRLRGSGGLGSEPETGDRASPRSSG